MTVYNDELYIGAYEDGESEMVPISSLGEDPESGTPAIAEGSFSVDPAHRSAIARLGDGTERENGWLQCAWHVNGLRGSQYDALAEFKSDHTSRVYIRTLKNDGKTYANYEAYMIWPVKPLRSDPTASEDGAVFDFELRFIKMIEQAGI